MFTILFIALTTIGIASAASAATLSGTVKDQASNPIQGATVDILVQATSTVVASGTTDANGFYSIVVADGLYDVRVTPPANSGSGPSIAFGIGIFNDTQLDFRLPSSTIVTLTLRILDYGNMGVPFQALQLAPAGGGVGAFGGTDAVGEFRTQVPAGSYFIIVNGSNLSLDAKAPQAYNIQSGAFAVTANAVVDFKLPVRRVQVHVQDTRGAAVSNVGLSTNNPFSCELTFGPTTACGSGGYSFDPSATPAAGRTDNSGNASLYLFTTAAAGPNYDITATPAASSGFAPATAANVAVTGDISVTITLADANVFRGRLLDRDQMPLVNQFVQFIAEGAETGSTALTDDAGRFAFEAAPGIRYSVSVSGDNQNFARSAPQSYAITSAFFTPPATEQVFDLPVKRVNVHVQTGAEPPEVVANAGFSSNAVLNCSLPFGPTTACGLSSYTFLGGTDGVTNNDGDATLWLFPTPATPPDPLGPSSYTLTAIPPSGSGLAPGTAADVSFADDTSVTITLNAPLIVSGRVSDGLNAGIPGQIVELASQTNGNGVSVLTNDQGDYEAPTQADSYRLFVIGDNQNFTAAAPQFYSLSTVPFAVSASQVVNVPLPVKRLDVRVVQQNGAVTTPIPGVGLSAIGPTNCGLLVGSLTTCGTSGFFYIAPPPGSPAPSTGVTDADGNMTLWLFPTPVTDPASPGYDLTATPTADSGFVPTSIANVTVTDNATLVIVLDAAHAAPVTTLTIAETPNGNGEYPDPVTITLSATTAAVGFTVANTLYEVDGGGLVSYNGAFNVFGAGPHVVRYFSVDDSGIAEVPKVETFTIFQAAPPGATLTPAPNAAGWNKENVTVTLSAVGEGTAILSITYSVSGAQTIPETTVPGNTASFLISVEGTSVVTFFATDILGHVGASSSVTVNLDKTAPAIDVTTPVSSAFYGLGAMVPVLVSCSDVGGSGIASCVAPSLLDTSSIGTKSLTVVATDRADNETTKAVTYRVGGKNECKNGGWQLFASPIFRNQGQCVSSFAR